MAVQPAQLLPESLSLLVGLPREIVQQALLRAIPTVPPALVFQGFPEMS